MCLPVIGGDIWSTHTTSCSFLRLSQGGLINCKGGKYAVKAVTHILAQVSVHPVPVLPLQCVVASPGKNNVIKIANLSLNLSGK